MTIIHQWKGECHKAFDLAWYMQTGVRIRIKREEELEAALTVSNSVGKMPPLPPESKKTPLPKMYRYTDKGGSRNA